MKKLICLVLALLMMASAAGADTVINSTENRHITPKAVGLNEVPEDISPTTGRVLSSLPVPKSFAGLALTGRYMPMLVQIDNTNGGVTYYDEGGKKRTRNPWGATYVDIVYESPLYESGETRLSFLYSDVIPSAVGPVRSARIGHAWLREEWDCGFMFYGYQSAAKTNVLAEFERYGADKKGVLFSGTVGSNKAWKQYYTKRKNLSTPHDKNGNAAAMTALIPNSHTAPNHAFLFTEEEMEGDTATVINVNYNHFAYNNTLEYNPRDGQYYRYVRDDHILWTDLDTQTAITFSNVIVQYVHVDWFGTNAPMMQNVVDSSNMKRFSNKAKVAEGNADFFLNGQHVAGFWQRKGMSDRTVFYDADGNELALHPGRTLIIMFPRGDGKYGDRERYVSYR
ncbi:MAG: DUF3048 C-terminal domain-containing protein [Clostridia bacterium]|nr:DUF3048 C-terminal domain-containing protein [Clostridia bacterium]